MHSWHVPMTQVIQIPEILDIDILVIVSNIMFH